MIKKLPEELTKNGWWFALSYDPEKDLHNLLIARPEWFTNNLSQSRKLPSWSAKTLDELCNNVNEGIR